MLLPHLSSTVANADEGVYRGAVLRQYKHKIRLEEEIHTKQLTRVAGYDFEDAFSLHDIRSMIGTTQSGNWCVDFQSKEQVGAQMRIYRDIIAAEKERSDKYLEVNRPYMEWKANEIAGYRESYKYHCSYERTGYPHPPVQKINK